MPRKSLKELCGILEPLEIVGRAENLISNLSCDSRRVEKDCLFFALQGGKLDGNQFIPRAVAAGAVAVVTERGNAPVPPGVSSILVENARAALAAASTAFYDHPTRSMQVIGITGTNGKTTTAYLVHSILQAAGRSGGLFGTVEYRIGDRVVPATNTTPESLDLQMFFDELRRNGRQHVVMEVSSHALEMHRVDYCRFALGVFTNLTRDHLDFHHTMDNYFAAKRKLFEGLKADPPEWAILNIDDPYGARLHRELSLRKLTYGFGDRAEVRATRIHYSFEGVRFTALTPQGELAVESPLVGPPNVYNILAAIAAAEAQDIDMPTIQTGIKNLRYVPGRFERVDCGQPFAVVVDYAHTDDALKNVITAARKLTKRKIITVFGCGGDRDRAKRPLMGEVAGRLSDLIILTSDNPRTEEPLRIIADTVVGLQKATDQYVVEPDRAKAIRRALEAAHEGDIVLLAGKGHETYQVVGDRILPFNDREVAREILVELGYDAHVCN
ncbi:MAG: UDP-N-acetylmuramoyl-L-alanyl-D-glutamate--2,6-diaminopimelate ligase [Acidobacteriia bacterium]|nr:UDP-N-acetylmuramoyl-L-alanyl-D-glutamate--2,6-diaminopimelate ligase [Terriglobia bacterium]